jgi:hypothetical protein
MTSLVVEHLDPPTSTRDIRALGAAGDRAGDVLAGRTIWCAAALPGGRALAQELGMRLSGAGPSVAAAQLQVREAAEQLRRLAQRIDEMMSGAGGAQPGLGRGDEDIYAEAARDSEGLVGDGVGQEDVVVAHDALSAVLAQAVRERGAHAVWRVRIASSSPASARRALEFLGRLAPGIDAYLLSWIERTPRGERLERVAAAMPSAGIVAAKEFPSPGLGNEPRPLAWRMALAEVVRTDRGEAVGGTLHPKPTVAAR